MNERDQRRAWERWMGDDDMEGAARSLGFKVLGLEVEGAALRSWGLEPADLEEEERLEVMAADGELKVLGLRSGRRWSEVRRLVSKVGSAAPEATVLWWWSDGREWTLACVDELDGRRKIRRMSTLLEKPDEVGLLGWWSLSPQRVVGDECGRDWAEHLRSVLDQEGVTRAFFEEFSKGLEELKEKMIEGPGEERERHELALVTLLRVVFLYFLQARGALDGDRRFMMRHWRGRGDEGGFYRQVLRPLFFGALNRPRARRDDVSRALGELPFLNGGLFEPSPLEERWPDLDWPDEVWSSLLEGLFERHRFAVEWEEDEELRCAVDPEMLGKVFEGLMYGGKRRQSGSFYTPRDVVREMVEGTLGSWLGEMATLSDEEVRAVLAGDAVAIGADRRGRVREVMGSMAIIDPAVGTGAFLLEALRVIRRVLVGLDEAEGVKRTPGERYERMRRIVQDHLSGVDIEPTAVRLCELRIWLAMLAALPELPAGAMPPLPNLGHRLKVGNALVEPADWARYRRAGESAPRSTSGGWDPATVERMRRMEEAYTRAHGEEKRELKRAIEERQRAVERELLEGQLRAVQEKLDRLEKVERSPDLFGEASGLSAGQERVKKRLNQHRSALEECLDDLSGDRRRGVGLCFGAHFAPIMARGGFDMVITNPPWVRQGRIEREERGLYRARFESVQRGLWEGAGEMGVKAPFGVQMDLAGIFVERSLELLKPGGRLCALVPSKLLRSLYGSGVRAMIAEHQVEFVEDRSESNQELFDATTYPAVLRVRKGVEARQSGAEIALWRGRERERCHCQVGELGLWGRAVGEPWVLVPTRIREIFKAMRRRSRPLGTIDGFQICGGIKTGANRVFIVDSEEAMGFPAAVRKRYLRPVIRGRDMGDGKVEKARQIIWTMDEEGEPRQSIPACLERYFEEHRDRLEGRSDYKRGPIWGVFRYRPEVEGAKVVWRDMAQRLEAVAMARETIPLNTVYYIPVDQEVQARALVGLFHSEAVRAWAWALGERARGGWRRHFAWVMQLLPVAREWLRLWEEAPAEAGKEEVIHRCFGLASEEVEVLRRWRLGLDGRQKREAA